MTTNTEPKLAAPGAGLPGPELLFARIIFRQFRKKHSTSDYNEMIQAHCHKLCTLVESCDDTSASTPILIKRLRGLEDSSRNWSLFMTLEHVRIVNNLVNGIILLLSKGRTPDTPASTANVKPNTTVGSEVINELQNCSEKLIDRVNSIDNLNTDANFAHPWFGPLDAASWHAMAAFHMRLHIKQAEAILKQL